MGSKVEYVESSQIQATNYVRNSKAIGVLWGIFTICYAIIDTVAFVTPEWIGETSKSEYPGRFGLWSSCYFGSGVGTGEDCHGRIDEIWRIPELPSKICAIFGAISVIIAIVTVLAFLLFFFFPSTNVFHICGWLQILSAICLIISTSVYPLSWGNARIQKTCGMEAGSYNLGDCDVRWAYMLAVIAFFDTLVLATLAFILATRHVKLQPEPLYGTAASLYKGEMNGGGYMGDATSIAGSRKSLNLHPVMLMPQPPMTDADRFSELSHRTGRSYRPEYISNVNHFQL